MAIGVGFAVSYFFKEEIFDILMRPLKAVMQEGDKVIFTGKKMTDKKFYWHTGYPGGIKERSWDQILDGKHPERLVQKAVERMLPKTKLGRAQYKKLFVYAGAEHQHAAQQPKPLDL